MKFPPQIHSCWKKTSCGMDQGFERVREGKGGRVSGGREEGRKDGREGGKEGERKGACLLILVGKGVVVESKEEGVQRTRHRIANNLTVCCRLRGWSLLGRAVRPYTLWGVKAQSSKSARAVTAACLCVYIPTSYKLLRHTHFSLAAFIWPSRPTVNVGLHD